MSNERHSLRDAVAHSAFRVTVWWGSPQDAERQSVCEAFHRSRILPAAGGFGNHAAQIRKKFPGRDDSVVVAVGLALQALEKVIRENTMAISPLGIFKRRLA